jgi:Undecaprenyl-phosphate glucose phosphotransferase
MFGRASPVYHVLMVVSDLALAAVAWVLAYFVRFESGLFAVPTGNQGPIVPDLAHYLQMLPALGVVLIICYRSSNLYTPRRMSQLRDELAAVFQANILLLICSSALALYANRTDVSRLSIMLFVLINVCGSMVLRSGGRLVLRSLRRAGINQRRALVVGDADAGERLAITFRTMPWTGIEVVGFLSDDPQWLAAGRRSAGAQDYPVLGGLADLRQVVEQRQIDQIFLALPWERLHQLHALVRDLDQQLADIRVVLDLSEFSLLNPRAEDFEGLPLLALRQSKLDVWGAIAKRGLDVMVASLLLAVFALPMLLIAVLVKVTSRGPVFYLQRRVGLDGREFLMIKFRTMAVDAEARTGAVMATRNDPRLTRLGMVLRRTSLDELPQLFNVLRGEMSMVGPRPERPELINELKLRIPDYMLRHKMKAGLTGWAQIHGLRGGEGGDAALRARIRKDLDYIENWSLLFDLWIMALTPLHIVVGHNAY